MTLYRILLGIDGLAAAVLLFFFGLGLQDGSVASYNIMLWLELLAGMALLLWGGIFFGRRRQFLPANLILATPAAPAILFGLFVLAAIILQPNWH